jgi:hypothetical protein
VRDALATLPWVEHSSIETDTNTQEVRFRLKDKSKFDVEEVKKAIAGKGFPNTTLKAGPS